MSTGLLGHLILAGSEDFARRLQPIQQGFHAEASDSNVFTILLILLGLAVLVVIMDQVYRTLAGRRPASLPDYLVQLGRVLGLSAADLRELRLLATRGKLPQPAASLLSPANLAYALQAAGLGDNPRARGRLERICQTAFGVPLPHTPA